MADILFVCKEGQEVAGCIDRIQVSVPFIAVDPASGRPFMAMNRQTRQPMIDPETGQPILQPDSNAAWAWVKQLPFPFPPGASFIGYIRSYQTPPDHGPPIVLIHHVREPAVSDKYVNAGQPDASPVGDSSEIIPPPVVGQKPTGPVTAREDPWEDIDRSGLSRNADTMMGDVDPQGGTFADVSPVDDQERKRVLEKRPAPPKPKLTPEVVQGFALQWYTQTNPQDRKRYWTKDPKVAMAETRNRLASTGTYDLT